MLKIRNLLKMSMEELLKAVKSRENCTAFIDSCIRFSRDDLEKAIVVYGSHKEIDNYLQDKKTYVTRKLPTDNIRVILHTKNKIPKFIILAIGKGEDK